MKEKYKRIAKNTIMIIAVFAFICFGYNIVRHRIIYELVLFHPKEARHIYCCRTCTSCLPYENSISYRIYLMNKLKEIGYL